jgi:hypothetical protein
MTSMHWSIFGAFNDNVISVVNVSKKTRKNEIYIYYVFDRKIHSLLMRLQ